MTFSVAPNARKCTFSFFKCQQSKTPHIRCKSSIKTPRSKHIGTSSSFSETEKMMLSTVTAAICVLHLAAANVVYTPPPTTYPPATVPPCTGYCPPGPPGPPGKPCTYRAFVVLACHTTICSCSVDKFPSQVLRETLALRVPPVPMENQVLKDPQDPQDPRGIRETKEILDSQEPPV